MVSGYFKVDEPKGVDDRRVLWEFVVVDRIFVIPSNNQCRVVACGG